MLMAIPCDFNEAEAVKNGLGPAQIIDANFSNAFATTYLVVVSIAIVVCLLAIQANTMRLCFGMARDDQLPGSILLKKVSPKLHTPWIACIVVTLIAAIPLLQYAGAAPTREAPFQAREWGIPVSILGLVWGGAMLVNIAWPRGRSSGRCSPRSRSRSHQADPWCGGGLGPR